MSHGLPDPPLEVPVQRSIEGLAPAFATKVQNVLGRLIDAEWDATIAESLRTNARQQYLYGFGREYDDGRGIVTHSQDADETWHHFGLAVDIVSRSKQWDAPDRFWDELGLAASAEGLTWGGTWHFRDLPHVQWGKPMRDSPSPRAARLLEQGGLPAVWAEVGALSPHEPL